MPDPETSTEKTNSVNIEDIGPCKKKVNIEIPEGTVKKATDEQYAQLRKDAVVPGFRKGRAPRRLLEKRFGKETSEQIKLKLLADSSSSAIKDNELDILREPEIDHENIELPESGPLKFDFEVEVRPEFELPPIENIPVKKTKMEVSDEQIDRELLQIRKHSGAWTPKKQDEPVETDDQIIASVTLKTEDTEEEEKVDNTEIYVRHNGFVAGVPVENLDELLTGSKAGQTVNTSVDVPKTYFREEYRGKKVDVSIHIKDVKWLKPAEMNDDFLKRYGVESEQELRDGIRQMLESRVEQQTRNEMTQQIYQYLLENTELELPTDIVADQSESQLKRQYSNLMMKGLSREQLDEQMEQLQASSEQQAKEQLKTFFIMDKVADKLDINVTEEEINGRIAQLAMQQGHRPEKMKEQMQQKGSLEQFKLQVREEKCINKLLGSANITEVEPGKDKSAEDNQGENAGKKQSKTEKEKPE